VWRRCDNLRQVGSGVGERSTSVGRILAREETFAAPEPAIHVGLMRSSHRPGGPSLAPSCQAADGTPRVLMAAVEMILWSGVFSGRRRS
jgi:hypothetical protein